MSAQPEYETTRETVIRQLRTRYDEKIEHEAVEEVLDQIANNSRAIAMTVLANYYDECDIGKQIKLLFNECVDDGIAVWEKDSIED